MVLLQGDKSVFNVFRVRSGEIGQVGASGLHQMLDLAYDLGVDERAENRVQKTEVGWRIVQHTGKRAAAPVEKSRCGTAQLAGVGLQPVQRGHHREENSQEQNGYFPDRMKIEMVRFVD